MTAPAVDAESMRAALDTFAMEVALGSVQEDAMAAALFAGIRASGQKMREMIASTAETFAMEMAAEEIADDGEPEFTVALRWFADKIRSDMDLDPSGDYEPRDHDVIEVTLTGPVDVTTAGCATCGCGSQHPVSWSVTDDQTGVEVTFMMKDAPRTRLLSRVKGEQANPA